MADPLPPVVAHAYVSTACQHNRHHDCGSGHTLAGGPKKPAVCKWCEVDCLCPAHRDPALNCIGALLTADELSTVDAYEPFVAAEGRREEAVLEGLAPGDELSPADVLALVRRHFAAAVSNDGRMHRVDDLSYVLLDDVPDPAPTLAAAALKPRRYTGGDTS
jgi:hypothetical protein